MRAYLLVLMLFYAGCATAPAPVPTPDRDPAVSNPAPATAWPAEADRFRVLELKAVIDDDAPEMQEVPGALKITAPPFRVAAKVFCDLPADSGWSVGFVQAVLDKEQRNYYPEAITSWEFPFLPINDSDGSYPWYSKRARKHACSGEASVFFSDGLWNSVTWREPRPDGVGSEAGPGWLEGFDRWQSFRVWLVALHEDTARVIVLRVIDWELRLALQVDTSRPLGSRARVIEVERPAPVVRRGDPADPLPRRLMAPPRANDADEFWWTPRDARLGERRRLRAAQWGSSGD